MNFGLKVMLPAVLLTLLTAGCYTKFYRPGMEQQGSGPFGQIYNRYDSSAIDTTLTQKVYEDYTTYPEYPVYDDWYNWGRPRHQRTRWGFDFYNFSPDYYWSYYGYYDYYGTPWWRSWYDPYYWRYPYGWGGSGDPVEPPSKRPGDRGRLGGGSSYTAPPPASGGGGSYATPPPASPPPSSDPPRQQPTNDTKPPQQPSGDSNKHSGGRGR